MEEQRHTLSASERGELARARSWEYRYSIRKEKNAILNEFVAATGVKRKTAIALLGRPTREKALTRGRPRNSYRAYVQAA